MKPLLIQPGRLRVPAYTRKRLRALFALDAAVVTGGVVVAIGGAVIASLVVDSGETRLLFVLGAVALGLLVAVPGVVGIVTGLAMRRRFDSVERDGQPVMWARADESFAYLAPGPKFNPHREVPIPRGWAVHVDVAPDPQALLFWVPVALRWRVLGPYGMLTFRTYFEPDPAYFEEVRLALASVGIAAAFSYQPLSYRPSIPDL